MSESNGKTFRGLHEAYASIYGNKFENLTEDTIVSEVQEEQEFEINEEALCNLFINYLVVEGYAKTENQAVNMIPHIGEEWFNGIVNHLSLSEGFYSCVDSLVKEGYDLSSYKEEDLFESYLEGYCSQNLNEVALAAAPWAWGALTGLVGGAAHLLKGMNRPKPATTGPSTWDYGQSGTSTYKPKPAPVVAKPKPTPVVKSKAEDPWAADRPSSQAAIDAQREAAAKASAKAKQQAQSTPAPGPGGGPPEDPEKENAWERAQRRRAERKADQQQKKQQQANQPQTANQRIVDKFKEYAADKALGGVEALKRGAKPTLGWGLSGVGALAGLKATDWMTRPALDYMTNQNYSRARKWLGKQFNQATGQTNAQAEFEKANK